MAVEFAQDFGAGHTSIYKSFIAASPPMTLACFFNADTFTAARVLIEIGQRSTSNHYGLVLSGGASSGTVVANVRDFVFQERAETTDTFSFGAWYHAAATFSGTEIVAYLDGVASATVTQTMNPTVAALTSIGGENNTTSSTFGFIGCLAYAGIWDTVLSPSSISQLAAGVSPGSVQSGNLIAFLPLSAEASALAEIVNTENWTLFEAGAGISTCPDAPSFPSGSSTVRIMG